MFANGPVEPSSIQGRVMPKTFKKVLDNSLLNAQQFKVHIGGKVEQSRKRSSAPLHLGVVAIEKGAFWSPSTTVAHFTYFILNSNIIFNILHISHDLDNDSKQSFSFCLYFVRDITEEWM